MQDTLHPFPLLASLSKGRGWVKGGGSRIGLLRERTNQLLALVRFSWKMCKKVVFEIYTKKRKGDLS